MRILVLGAGGTGGCFGGRMLAAGCDVTFLVRPARAKRLAETGLAIKSPLGDVRIPDPPTTTDAASGGPWDLILLACKAYDLETAIAAIAPAAGPDTLILPILNGMTHVERLQAAFGAGRVLGGLAKISAALAADGTVVQYGTFQSITFGPWDGRITPRCEAVREILARGGFETTLTPSIRQAMWDKWTFIAVCAGITCLMRGAVSDIVAGGGKPLVQALWAECAGIAAAQGFPIAKAVADKSLEMMTDPASPLTASMLRDLEGGGRIESEQIVGDLLRLAAPGTPVPVLSAAYVHLKTYEARRLREAAQV